VEYEYIDPASETPKLHKDRARDYERNAMFAELDAAQYLAAARAVPDRPGIKQQADDYRRAAEQKRAVADAVHNLAGTSPDAYAAEFIPDLRGRLEAMERQHLFHMDSFTNADVYDVKEEDMRHAAAEIEAGILAMREKFKSLEAAAKRHAVSEVEEGE